MPFPLHRPRRLRATPALRALVRETNLAPRRLRLAAVLQRRAIDEPRPIGDDAGRLRSSP